MVQLYLLVLFGVWMATLPESNGLWDVRLSFLFTILDSLPVHSQFCSFDRSHGRHPELNACNPKHFWSPPNLKLFLRVVGNPPKKHLNITHDASMGQLYIYLHLVESYGKCRYIYHTWQTWMLYIICLIMKHVVQLAPTFFLADWPWEVRRPRVESTSSPIRKHDFTPRVWRIVTSKWAIYVDEKMTVSSHPYVITLVGPYINELRSSHDMFECPS